MTGAVEGPDGSGAGAVAPPPPRLLSVRRLSKSFGGTRALVDVSLDVVPGEVHGLLGENGSGKSTLIKVLAGFHAPDDGEVEVRGDPVGLPLAPGQFRKLGMDFVHQDLGLIPSLTVLENLRLGELATARGRPYISWRRERMAARETFVRYGLDLDPTMRVGDLPAVRRALLAIVRAVEGMRHASAEANTDQGLLFLDEPTAFLPRDQVDRLFGLVRQIVRSNSSVVFVSHDLEEVMEITDRVTILRNGRRVGTVVTRQTSHDELVHMIIGQELTTLGRTRQDRYEEQPAVRVRGLGGTYVRSSSFEVREHEVLGLTGLMGAGFEDIPYLLFGARGPAEGELTLGGRVLDLASLTPSRAIAAGMGLIPSDRQRDGSVGSLPITDNLTLPVLDRYFTHLALSRTRMTREARRLMEAFDVRPPDPTMTYAALSGGNQQKVMLAKWLQTRPRLLLLHEPTQGVDVGARQRIMSMIREAVADRTVVICASADHEQLALLCDRVLIFARGELVRELAGDEVTKERITEQCLRSGQVGAG
jgi:ribose transport system ATP-binding protein